MLVWLAMSLRAMDVSVTGAIAPPTGLDTPGLLAGAVLAVFAGWAGSRIARAEMAWRISVLLPLVLPFIPVPVSDHMTLARGLAGYPADVLARGYSLIKGAFLWIPIGFVLVFAGAHVAARYWTLAMLAGALPVVLGGGIELSTAGTLSLLASLPGMALGLALGEAIEGRREREQLTDPGFAHAEGSRATVRHEGSDRRSPASKRAKRSASPRSLGVIQALISLSLLALAFWGALEIPRWGGWLAAGLALYGITLWRWPGIWLVLVPAALPLLDLAPWTGRFFLDEFDLVMLVTAGMMLLRGVPARQQPLLPGAGMLMSLCGISVLVSLLAGLLPMPAMDANAFSSYWSPYNSLRIAKGMAWGGLVFLWVRHSGLAMDVLGRRMAVGMGVGLLGVGLMGVWEHWLFNSQSNGTYRIFSTFSSMHTGGGHIEAYLAAAVPFLWLYMGRWRDLALSGPLLLLTTLAMLYTVARGGLLALGVVVAILVVASIRLAGARRAIMPLALMLAVAVALGVGAGGGYLQQRLAQTGQDWQIRVDHWALALGLRDDSALTGLFGMGLGSFPRAYLQRGPVDKQSGTYAFAREGDNTYLRLGGGDTLYYAQRVDLKGGQGYRLELDARADGAAARIETPVCEKQMLNSRQCVWLSFDVPGDGQWHRLSRSFASADIGGEPAWRRPPVEMFLYMPVKGGVMAVDNLHLIGPDGRDLLCNGDFGQGGDCWFFKTHSHLPWHIKNLWVHVLFEQGWVGLLLLTGLIGLALYRLGKAGWRGHRLAWVWLASLAGLLTVGMFDSLLDAPRLATLLMAWTLLGAGNDWPPIRVRSGAPGGTLPPHRRR